MGNFSVWNDWANFLFLLFSGSLFSLYSISAILSIVELRKYIKKSRNFDYRAMLTFSKLPTVSIIAPAFNEEKTIIENINCLLTVQYHSGYFSQL